ncbi:MAG: mandelate racemase/muconate lactonizing enzyme family protein [Planctomycetia bacterium]|nr:mandelate racemase/muconate lactonizing enzyme family protein [Planctomycetia bacterium]
MHISDLELFVIELPASGGAVRSLVVRLATDSGLEGWGETRKAWRPGELAARRGALLSVLAGREVFDVESMLALDALGDRAVACAVEMALWDLIARAAEQPLCHLFGGGYRQRVPLSVRLPAGAAETVAHWSRAFSAQAVQSQMITSSGSPEADLKLLAAVREACEDRVQFRLDARGQYDLPKALHLCAALEPGSVQFVLDPLAGGQPERLPALRSVSGVPLGVFAGIERPADIFHLACANAAAFVVVDPVQVGGLLRARQCGAVAEAAGLAASLRIEGTSGLALAASLQLAAATPSFISGHECSYPKLQDDILAEPLRIVDGMVAVPSAPGLGVAVDRDKLDLYQVGG